MKKKIIATLIAVCTIVCILPTSIFAGSGRFGDNWAGATYTCPYTGRYYEYQTYGYTRDGYYNIYASSAKSTSLGNCIYIPGYSYSWTRNYIEDYGYGFEGECVKGRTSNVYYLYDFDNRSYLKADGSYV
ncbi:MAG: hypothetical protein RSE07_06510, partial [Oscillospiraceae bacterium]